MTYRMKSVEGLVADTDHDLGVVRLGSRFARVHGIRARNWASAAKGGAGTDTLMKIKLTDANGDVFYLDAADRDYATAEVTLAIGGGDDTATGLGITPVDATGAAASAGAGIIPVIESPVTVTVLNGATATDYFVVQLIVESN